MAENKLSLHLIKQQDVFPSMVSVIIPLVQLIAVVVVGLSDTFNIKDLLLFPNFLNLINLLTMVATLTAISWFWYWKNNIHWFGWTKDQEKTISNPQKKVEALMRNSLLLSILFFVGFIALTVFSTEGYLTQTRALGGTLQYLAYSLFLVLSGLVIYVWIYEFILKKQTFQREDFTRNLLLTLEEYNLIKRPDVRITRNEFKQGLERHLEIEIEKKKYILRTSLDGLEILEILDEHEYEKSDRRVTVEELQAQVGALLKQIEELQSQPRSSASSGVNTP